MYQKSGCDKDIILTFLSENDSMWLRRPSGFKWFDGNHWYGICQMYYTWHKDFIDSPEMDDPYLQMDRCIGIWNDAKARNRIWQTFHAYSFRHNALKKVVFNN